MKFEFYKVPLEAYYLGLSIVYEPDDIIAVEQDYGQLKYHGCEKVSINLDLWNTSFIVGVAWRLR